MAQTSPQGNVDVVDGGVCRLAGWAIDPDRTTPINVQVLADGVAGTGTPVATILANLQRPDLPFSTQNHGFDFTFVGAAKISDGNPHTLYVYAIDVSGDPNRLLNPQGSSINCGSLNVSAKDFGAKGDGAADDGPAIQAAINATAPGGTVLIPAGTYMLKSSAGAPGDMYASAPCNAGQDLHVQDALIISKPNVTLTGTGRDTILKLGPAAKLQMVDLIGSNESVRKLVVDGNGAARIRIDPSTGHAYGWPCGLVVATLIAVGPLNTPSRIANNALIQDVEARYALEDGASGFLASGMVLDRIYAHDNGGVAFGYPLDSGASAVEVAGGSNARITNNVLLANSTGMQVSFGVTGTVVENNVSMENCGYGLGLGSNYAYQFDLLNIGISVTANWLESNGTVCDNAGLIVYAGVQNASILGNSMVNNNWIGALVEDEGAPHPFPSNIDFENNLLANLVPSRPQHNGFVIRGRAQGVTLKHNNVFDNATSPADQVLIQDSAMVNSDWASANTISYSPPVTGAVPQITSSGILNAAGGLPGAIAPGEILLINGVSVGPASRVAAIPGTYYPRLLAATRVLFDKVPAPVLSVSSTQDIVVVPYFEYWRDNAQVQVEYQGVLSNAVTMSIAPSAPGLFSSVSGSAVGFGSILNQDNSVNSSANPANTGSTIALFVTGEGQTDPGESTGE